MNPDTQRLCAPLFPPDHPSNDSHNVHRQVFLTPADNVNDLHTTGAGSFWGARLQSIPKR